MFCSRYVSSERWVKACNQLLYSFVMLGFFLNILELYPSVNLPHVRTHATTLHSVLVCKWYNIHLHFLRSFLQKLQFFIWELNTEHLLNAYWTSCLIDCQETVLWTVLNRFPVKERQDFISVTRSWVVWKLWSFVLISSGNTAGSWWTKSELLVYL